MQHLAQTTPAVPTMTKVFVGGISRDTTEESLADYFELHFGSIITVDIKRQWSALSRHFAFVTLTDSNAALRAVTANDHHIDGHDVEVEYAKLQPDRHPVRVQSAAKPVVGVGGTSPNENEEGVSRGRKLFVGGLAPKTEECTLSEHFRQYGSVDNAAIKRYPNGVSKQFGFVTFSTLAAARWAVMQEAHFVDGHSMNVDYAEYQPDRRPARVRTPHRKKSRIGCTMPEVLKKQPPRRRQGARLGVIQKRTGRAEVFRAKTPLAVQSPRRDRLIARHVVSTKLWTSYTQPALLFAGVLLRRLRPLFSKLRS